MLGRNRRDARRLLDIVRVIAWIYQYQRERDPANRIITTEDDFKTALTLVGDSLARAWQTLTPAKEKVVAAILSLPEPNQIGGFKRPDLKLTTSEFIGTIASHMRSNMSDFLNERGEVDVDRIKEQGHLVKRLKVRRTYQGKGEEKLLTETVEVELYDAQAAAFKLASLMGLENWQYHVDIAEQQRLVVTGFVQSLSITAGH